MKTDLIVVLSDVRTGKISLSAGLSRLRNPEDKKALLRAYQNKTIWKSGATMNREQLIALVKGLPVPEEPVFGKDLIKSAFLSRDFADLEKAKLPAGWDKTRVKKVMKTGEDPGETKPKSSGVPKEKKAKQGPPKESWLEIRGRAGRGELAKPEAADLAMSGYATAAMHGSGHPRYKGLMQAAKFQEQESQRFETGGNRSRSAAAEHGTLRTGHEMAQGRDTFRVNGKDHPLDPNHEGWEGKDNLDMARQHDHKAHQIMQSIGDESQHSPVAKVGMGASAYHRGAADTYRERHSGAAVSHVAEPGHKAAAQHWENMTTDRKSPLDRGGPAPEIRKKSLTDFLKGGVIDIPGLGDWALIKAKVDFFEENPLELEKAVLTASSRAKIKRKNFALPGRADTSEEKKESGNYPIPDISHARNALARVAQHGTPEEQKRVRAAVYKKFPSLRKSQDMLKCMNLPGRAGIRGKKNKEELVRGSKYFYVMKAVDNDEDLDDPATLLDPTDPKAKPRVENPRTSPRRQKEMAKLARERREGKKLPPSKGNTAGEEAMHIPGPGAQASAMTPEPMHVLSAPSERDEPERSGHERLNKTRKSITYYITL